MICTCALAGTAACNNCPNNKMIAGYTVIDFKTPVIKTPNKDELEIMEGLNICYYYMDIIYKEGTEDYINIENKSIDLRKKVFDILESKEDGLSEITDELLEVVDKLENINSLYLYTVFELSNQPKKNLTFNNSNLYYKNMDKFINKYNMYNLDNVFLATNKQVRI